MTWDNAAQYMKVTPAMQAMPVQAAITSPKPGTALAPDDTSVVVSGYAFSGGGRPITRVDLSTDGGVSWRSAALDTGDEDTAAKGTDRHWAWTLWSAEVPVPVTSDGKVCVSLAHAEVCACE